LKKGKLREGGSEAYERIVMEEKEGV